MLYTDAENPISNHVYEKIGYVKRVECEELEFYEYNSAIHGVAGLNRFLDDYDGWLLKLEEDRNRIHNEEKVPTETFFLLEKIITKENNKAKYEYLQDKEQMYCMKYQ